MSALSPPTVERATTAGPWAVVGGLSALTETGSCPWYSHMPLGWRRGRHEPVSVSALSGTRPAQPSESPAVAPPGMAAGGWGRVPLSALTEEASCKVARSKARCCGFESHQLASSVSALSEGAQTEAAVLGSNPGRPPQGSKRPEQSSLQAPSLSASSALSWERRRGCAQAARMAGALSPTPGGVPAGGPS